MATKLSSDDLFDLSEAFHKLSMSIGQYRFDNADTLTKKQGRQLEGIQWTLFNMSSDLNAQSGLAKIKALDDEISTLMDATARMGNAVKKITTVRKTITISTRAVALGGAIYVAVSTGNVGGVFDTAQKLIDAIAEKPETT